MAGSVMDDLAKYSLSDIARMGWAFALTKLFWPIKRFDEVSGMWVAA